MADRSSRLVLPGLAILTALTLPAALSPASAAGDAAAGRAVYQSVCSLCHAIQPGANRIGPTLFGLIGRKSGTVPGYTYSSANKNAGVIWNESTLDVYLQAPHQMMPGTKMSYAGLKDPTKRADLIAFLATLK